MTRPLFIEIMLLASWGEGGRRQAERSYVSKVRGIIRVGSGSEIKLTN